MEAKEVEEVALAESLGIVSVIDFPSRLLLYTV